MKVTKGKRVSIEYTMHLPNKSPFDSNVGKKPLTYTQGSDEVPAALQAKLRGLAVGGTKEVTLKPEQAFGPVDPEAFRTVDRSLIPKKAQKVGASLKASDPKTGEDRILRIHDVRDDKIVLDFNHPLAGKTLVVDVKIVAIK